MTSFQIAQGNLLMNIVVVDFHMFGPSMKDWIDGEMKHTNFITIKK